MSLLVSIIIALQLNVSTTLDKSISHLAFSKTDTTIVEPNKIERNRLYNIVDLYDADIVQLSGRVYFDLGILEQKDKTISSSTTDISYGTLFRSARFRAEGGLAPGLRWRGELEIVQNRFTLRGFFFQYTMAENTILMFGNIIKEPLGLERMSPLGWYSFVELSPAVSAFMPDRNLSFRIDNRGSRYNFLLSFLTGADQLRSADLGSGYAVASRFSFAPHVSQTSFIHLGYNFSLRRNSRIIFKDDDEENRRYNFFSFGPTRGSRAIGSQVAGASSIDDVKANNRHIIEMATGYKSWYLSGEVFQTSINQPTNKNLNFYSFYTQTGLFLTGDRRPYNPSRGTFGAISPRNPFNNGSGTGAIEIAARFSYLNLQNGSYDGGITHQYALALNWFLDRDTTFTLNLMRQNIQFLENQRVEQNIFAARVTFEF